MSSSLTMSQLESVYANTILAENANLAPSLTEGQDLYFNQKATCQIVSSVSQEVQQFENNIFPGSSSNAFTARHASSLGIPNITGGQPTQGSLTLVASGSPTSAFTITAGSILTNPITAIQYQTTSAVSFTTSTPFTSIPIPFQSVLSGSDTYCVPGTQLTFAVPLVVGAVTVNFATNNTDTVSGSNTPSNVDLTALVTTYMQNPRGGGSTGDYFNWALESSPLITFADIIPNGAVINQNIIYVAAFTGSGNPNINIALAFPISRSATLSTEATMGAYI